MNRTRRLMIAVVILSLLVLSKRVFAQDLVDQYDAEDGLRIVSYSPHWQGSLLAEVSLELKNNRHGNEMEYLDRVEIHPALEPGENEHVAASYQKESQQLEIPINLSGFLPDDYALPARIDKGVIRIYRAEEKQTIRDIAVDLSHEYGHHFTLFHFGEVFASPESFKQSPYFAARQLDAFQEVNGEYSYEADIHRWSIYEIAAEDYRQLLGSSTGKGITDFADISQKTGRQTYQPVNMATPYDFNALPQENWDIPLAYQVEGLQRFFSSFLPEPQEMEYVMGDLPVLTYREEMHHGFRKGIIEWEPVSWTEEVTYTVVAYTEENQVIPVRTVSPGGEPRAVIGTVTMVDDQYIYYYHDGLDHNTLQFRLHIQWKDGKIMASDRLTIVFDD